MLALKNEISMDLITYNGHAVLHAEIADESVCIGPPSVQDSYLNMNALISACQNTGAEALHPGFGFLSESAEFAQLCIDNGITFIGPSAEVIERMGNKSEARNTMIRRP